MLANFCGFKTEFKPMNGASQSKAPSPTAIPMYTGVLGCSALVVPACQATAPLLFSFNVQYLFFIFDYYFVDLKILTDQGSNSKVSPDDNCVLSSSSLPESDLKVTCCFSCE